MVLFGEETDWKEFLYDDVKAEVAELIDKAKKHRSAYAQADDVKVAQLWCALAEVSRQLKNIEDRLEMVESGIKPIAVMGDFAKRELLREKLRDMFKPKTPEEREQIEKIVETLMQF